MISKRPFIKCKTFLTLKTLLTNLIIRSTFSIADKHFSVLTNTQRKNFLLRHLKAFLLVELFNVMMLMRNGIVMMSDSNVFHDYFAGFKRYSLALDFEPVQSLSGDLSAETGQVQVFGPLKGNFPRRSELQVVAGAGPDEPGFDAPGDAQSGRIRFQSFDRKFYLLLGNFHHFLALVVYCEFFSFASNALGICCKKNASKSVLIKNKG